MTAKLLLDEPPLCVQRSLAVRYGLHEAHVLQQLHYRLQRPTGYHDGRPWYAATMTDWQREFPFIPLRTLYRLFRRLEKKLRLIESRCLSRDKSDRTKWYTLNYDQLSRAPRPTSSCQNGSMEQPATVAGSLLKEQEEKTQDDFSSSYTDEEVPPAPQPVVPQPLVKPTPACHYPRTPASPAAPEQGRCLQRLATAPPGGRPSSPTRIDTALAQGEAHARPPRYIPPPPVRQQASPGFALDREIPQCREEDQLWDAFHRVPAPQRTGILAQAEQLRTRARTYCEPLRNAVIALLYELGGLAYVRSLCPA